MPAKKTPFLIGLTGPMGSGKSLVRRMLEHLGALTVDADRLAHDAYEIGTEGHTAVVERFGEQILEKDGSINRMVLGEMVFKDPRALVDLEEITHPLVTAAVRKIAAASPLPILAVEAIKLLESGLKGLCSAIWVVNAPDSVLIDRLISTRGVSEQAIRSRLAQQSDFSSVNEESITTIWNKEGAFALWENVMECWHDLARTSGRFQGAVMEAKGLYQPFSGSLVNPSSENVEWLETHCGLSGSFEDRFMELATHLIWKIQPGAHEPGFLFSELENRSLNILRVPDRVETENLKGSLEIIEQFAKLHLCSRVRILRGKVDESFFREIGYDRNSGQENGLSKILMPGLRLFKEIK